MVTTYHAAHRHIFHDHANPRAGICRLHAFGTPVANPWNNSTTGIHLPMSFRRKSPNVVVSVAMGALVGLALVGGAIGLLTMPAMAQPPSPATQVSQTNGGNSISTGSITANGAGVIVGSASGIGNSATFITTQSGN
jgi:hypothetical protein